MWVHPVEARDRGGRQAKRHPEGGQSTKVIPRRGTISVCSKRESPVRRGVADGSEQLAERIGQRCRQDQSQDGVDGDIGQRAGDPDCGEAAQLARKAPDATEVLERRRYQVDPRIRVVDPVDGNFVDAQARPLSRDEQLRVEEPGLILN